MKLRICLFTLFMSMSTVVASALTHETEDSEADDWLWLRLLIWFGLMAGLNYYMKKSEAKERSRRAANKALTPGLAGDGTDDDSDDDSDSDDSDCDFDFDFD